MNTKPNRDITADWEKKFDEEYKGQELCLCDNESDYNDYKDLKSFIAQLLSTRTNELLGVMEEIVEYEPYLACSFISENNIRILRNKLRAEQNKKLATLRDKYEK